MYSHRGVFIKALTCNDKFMSAARIYVLEAIMCAYTPHHGTETLRMRGMQQSTQVFYKAFIFFCAV